jgi:hypothetical protein
MAYIKEPKGVDFIIKSEPLTDEERKAISKFIIDYKAKHSKTRASKARASSTKKKSLV